jgi:hypothetical protein
MLLRQCLSADSVLFVITKAVVQNEHIGEVLAGIAEGLGNLR